MNGYLFLWLMFAKIGLFSFGGGYAMLPLIFQTVEEAGFMTAEQFSDLVALSQVTPGPVAVNAATNVGFNYAGLPGAFAATLGVCLPAFILMMIVYHFIKKFNDNRTIQGIMTGIRPVTVALIGAAVIYVSETVLVNGPLISQKLIEAGTDYLNLIPLVIFAVTIVLVSVFKMKPIRVMILMGIAGALLCS